MTNEPNDMPDTCPWGCNPKHGLTKGQRDMHGDLNQNYHVWCKHADISAADRVRAVTAWNTRTAVSDEALAKLQADYDALLAHQASELGSVMADVRDRALEEAAKDITVGYEEFEDCVVVDNLKDAYAISRQQAAKELRALKGKTDA